MKLEVLDDAEAVAARAAGILARAHGHVALSGGSTPKRAYALAAERRADWSGVTLWLGDERHVPATDPDANARMVREDLLARVPGATAPNFEPVDVSCDLEGAARDYETRLRAALGEDGALDLALMGLGPDGHTASLFPGRPEAGERERWVAAVPEAGMDPRVPRVSLTLPVFDAAREVVFLIAGEGKAEAVRAVFAEPRDTSLPAALVQPESGVLRVLVDRAAAALL